MLVRGREPCTKIAKPDNAANPFATVLTSSSDVQTEQIMTHRRRVLVATHKSTKHVTSSAASVLILADQAGQTALHPSGLPRALVPCGSPYEDLTTLPKGQTFKQPFWT